MKLIKDNERKIYTYIIESDIYNGFILEIEEKKDIFDLWLYHNNTGIKDYIFGLPKDNPESKTIEDCLSIAVNNLPSYISTYIEEYI